MSSKSGVSSTPCQSQDNRPVTFNTTSTTAQAGKAEPAGIGGGFALQESTVSDKSYAAQLGLPSPAADYSWASICPFTAGQYTEF
jgi:hypothetical protein